MKKIFLYSSLFIIILLNTSSFAAQPSPRIDQSLPISEYDKNVCAYKRAIDASNLAKNDFSNALQILRQRTPGTPEHAMATNDFVQKHTKFVLAEQARVEALKARDLSPRSSTPGKKVLAEVSGPGTYVRGVSQNFPVTSHVSVYYNPSIDNTGIKVNIDGVGTVLLQAKNFAGIETDLGKKVYNDMLNNLKYIKPGTQVFIECKDPSGCRVFCNDDGYGCNGRLSCQTEVKQRLIRIFEGKYRLAWN